MPINSPDVFCFQIKLKETNVTVNPQPFTDIGKINKVAGFSCALGSNPGVLDKYPGAAAAYSLRKLSNTYSGSAVEVNNGVAVADIGFDSDGNLDLVALGAHCGARDGTISKWYDQSGNGFDAIQNTSGSQPKIYDSIEGVVMSNQRPAVDFNGTNHTLKTSNFASLIGAPNFYTSVVSYDDTADQYWIDSDAPGRSATGIISNNFSIRGVPGTTATTGQHVTSVSQLSTGATMFIDGAQALTNASSNLTTHTNILISDNALPFDGKYQELILWDSDQAANRTDIEADLNTYYAVYNQSPTGLLGSYPGASIGLSLRQLKSTSNYAIAVKRTSADNAITSIGFDANGGLDTAALAAFCGSDDGFIQVIYDQSGNGNDSVQINPVLNPKIYDGTTGVILDNNNVPSMEFASDSQDFRNEIFFRSNEPDAFLISLVADATEGASNGEYYGGQTNASTNWFATYGSTSNFRFRHTNDAGTGNTNTIWAYPTPAPSAGEMSNLILYIESETKKLNYNGQELTAAGNTVWTSTSSYKFNLGTLGRGYAENLNLKLSEFIAWPNQNGTGLSEIETNINTFYSIY